MPWHTQGVILPSAAAAAPWMISHVSVPCLDHLEGDRYRMYFCSRDERNRNQIGWADIDLNERVSIRQVSQQPVLGIGELGAFDDNGVTPTWILNVGSRKYMYYVGWNKGATVRMLLFVGLAISDDGGHSFQRYSRAPILERSSNDPFLTATLSILHENGTYRMWYVSGDGWISRDGETFPRYNIKYAESQNGIDWQRSGIVCIDYASSDEHAIARPCVLKDGNLYRMWYSYKGRDYRIGYAESADGLVWDRMDAAVGIEPTPMAFDSRMQEYAYVVNHRGKKYMFYNGDGYGETGLGYALLAE
jgi:hypothetical protein